MSFIVINNLTKLYPQDVGIHDLTLTIPRGKFVSIVGPFGSGKTTLLKILAGLITDFTGEVKIDGRTPLDVKKMRKVGLSFQQPTLLPWRNVIQNIMLPQEIVGSVDEQKARDLLQLVGLSDVAEKQISELSGGMKQLVSIIRSLILDPDILLLDEPFSSIDEMSKDMMHEKLLAIHRQSQKTTILVTHSLQEAVFLSDSVVVMSHSPGTIKRVIDIKLTHRTIEDKYSDESLHYLKLLRQELELS